MPRYAILQPQKNNDDIYLIDCVLNKYQLLPEFTSIVTKALSNNRHIRLNYSPSTSQWNIGTVGQDHPISDVNGFPELDKLKFSDMNSISQSINEIENFIVESAVKVDPIKPIIIEDKKIFEENKIPKLDHDELVNLIHSSYKLKPKGLFINEVKWKYLIRNILLGKNIMMEGPTGCGKTKSVISASKAFPERPLFYINMGSTQDPRSALIGNTHFKKETGTIFHQSYFVKAIQTPYAIILLDEITRSHPDADNILITVLDEEQRYLRLDEEENSPTISVAQGVCFMATANIGNEYTSTRKLDRAILDRFTRIEMDVLTKDQESDLLQLIYPKSSKKILKAIAEIADISRTEIKRPDSKISTIISTRASIEVGGLIYDGFTLTESADVVIYPLYSDIGGEDSERSYMKQVVQKYIEDNNYNDLFNLSNNITSEF